MPATLQEALTDSKPLLPLCLWLSSDLYLHSVFVRVFHKPDNIELLCFIFGWLGFNVPRFRHCWSSGRGSCSTMASAVLSHKTVSQLHSGSEFIVNYSTLQVPGSAAFNQHLCSYPGEWDSSMAPTGSFAHGEVVLPPPNALQGEPLPLCNPGDPQTTLPTPGSPPSSPTGTLPSPSGTTLGMAWTFRLCPLLIKTCGIQLLSFSPSVTLGKEFFLCNSVIVRYHSIFLFLSLLLLSLWSLLSPLAASGY